MFTRERKRVFFGGTNATITIAAAATTVAASEQLSKIDAKRLNQQTDDILRTRTCTHRR